MTMAFDYHNNDGNGARAQKYAAIATVLFSALLIIGIRLFINRKPDLANTNPTVASGMLLSLIGALVMLLIGCGWYLSCRRYEDQK